MKGIVKKILFGFGVLYPIDQGSSESKESTHKKIVWKIEIFDVGLIFGRNFRDSFPFILKSNSSLFPE